MADVKRFRFVPSYHDPEEPEPTGAMLVDSKGDWVKYADIKKAVAEAAAEAYETGKKVGHDAGYEEGFPEGRAQGYTAGYRQGAR